MSSAQEGETLITKKTSLTPYYHFSTILSSNRFFFKDICYCETLFCLKRVENSRNTLVTLLISDQYTTSPLWKKKGGFNAMV